MNAETKAKLEAMTKAHLEEYTLDALESEVLACKFDFGKGFEAGYVEGVQAERERIAKLMTEMYGPSTERACAIMFGTSPAEGGGE